MAKFKAYVVREQDGCIKGALEEIEHSFLSQGNTLVKAEYTSINYKDMLGVQTNGGVIRRYPMIPGIDLAGEVIQDDSGKYQPGDKLVITACDMGVKFTGGFSEYVQVDSHWSVPLAEPLTTREAMIYGTAGFTAAQSILALADHGMSVEQQPTILVTGASGGVGTVALAILNKMGFKNVTALIRKQYQEEIAFKLGATKVIYPSELGNLKPLSSAQWDFVVDTVGGDVASIALTQIKPNGAMSMCGNAAGYQLNSSVLPMILRGVSILGINSLDVVYEERLEIWNLLAEEWNVTQDLLVHTIPFDDIEKPIEQIRQGQHLGRSIIEF